jgi:multidrug efflux system membrane fusion protein
MENRHNVAQESAERPYVVTGHGEQLSPLELPAPATLVPVTAEKTSRSRQRWVWVAVVFLLAAGVYFLWPKITGRSTSSTPAKSAGASPAAVPVVAARSRAGDIGVYFTGLGTVTPLNTVTIKSRVDGQLLKVQYKEGELVHQSDVLAEIDPRPYQVLLTQAQGQLAKDQAALANAKVDLDRYQKLFADQVISQQQIATQQALVGQDQGAVEADQGPVDSAKLNIAYCHITAPITGRIGLRLVDPGNIVHASDANGLLVITQIQPISVLFSIAEDQLQVVRQKIQSGQKLSVDVYDRDMTTKIAQGSLTTIDNQIDPTTGTLKLRATFDNQDSALFPNQFVNVSLLVEQKHGVTLIPAAAIQRNSSSAYVYVVKADSTVTVRTITIGTTEGDDSEVTSGLSPGEVVVTTGVDKLVEGSKVTAQVPADSASPSPAQNPSPSTSPNRGVPASKGK